MKKLGKILLPAIIVLMAAGAAFATNATRNSNKAMAIGFYRNSSNQCVSSGEECSTSGSDACTWTDDDQVKHNLFQNETSCSNPLYRP